MNINVGDKLVATKGLTGFFDIGDVIKVTFVEGDLIYFATEDSPHTTGHLDFNACEKYFEKIFENFEEEIEKFEEIDTEESAHVIIDKYIEECIAKIMMNSEFETYTAFNKCVIVSCRLPNGFVIVESYTYTNPESYDEEAGINICIDKIADKIWDLEAYRLHEELYRDSMMDECPCDCDDCYNCPYGEDSCDDEFNGFCYNEDKCENEIDKCIDTDLDCDDCDDHNCPYRPN